MKDTTNINLVKLCTQKQANSLTAGHCTSPATNKGFERFSLACQPSGNQSVASLTGRQRSKKPIKKGSSQSASVKSVN